MGYDIAIYVLQIRWFKTPNILGLCALWFFKYHLKKHLKNGRQTLAKILENVLATSSKH